CLHRHSHGKRNIFLDTIIKRKTVSSFLSVSKSLNQIQKRILAIKKSLINFYRARRETRTLKGFLPTASETATFTNFATRAGGLEAQIYYKDSTCNMLLKKVFAP